MSNYKTASVAIPNETEREPRPFLESDEIQDLQSLDVKPELLEDISKIWRMSDYIKSKRSIEMALVILLNIVTIFILALPLIMTSQIASNLAEFVTYALFILAGIGLPLLSMLLFIIVFSDSKIALSRGFMRMFYKKSSILWRIRSILTALLTLSLLAANGSKWTAIVILASLLFVKFMDMLSKAKIGEYLKSIHDDNT